MACSLLKGEESEKSPIIKVGREETDQLAQRNDDLANLLIKYKYSVFHINRFS